MEAYGKPEPDVDRNARGGIVSNEELEPRGRNRCATWPSVAEATGRIIADGSSV